MNDFKPFRWNNCVIIEDKLLQTHKEAKKIRYALKNYLKTIGGANHFHAWYDEVEGAVFGNDLTWMNCDSKSSSFISLPHEFVYSDKKPNNSRTGKAWDIRYVLNYYGSFFGRDVICNNEIIYSNNKELLKFRDSKILVVAGGPSAKEVNWNPDDYDYIFSCNHFYLSEKMRSTTVDFATIGGEIDMTNKNKAFHNYMSKSNTMLCFEDRLSEAARKYFGPMKLKYGDRCVYAHTRYRGKPGAGLRLILYACFMGAAEVHFVGVDGMSKDTVKGDLHNHAFQPEKTYSHKSLDYGIYRRHYVMFWDYALNTLQLHKKIKFQNLGEGHEKNQSTEISRQNFPLEFDNGFC